MMAIPLPTVLLALTSLSLLCGIAGLAVALRKLGRDSARRLEALEVRLAKLESPVGKEPAKPIATRTRAKPAPGRRTDRSAPPGRTLISVPDLAASSPVSTPPPDDLTRRFGAIWDLAEAGVSPESIARDTGQPIGQIELILGLQRPRASSASGGPRLP
jgi:hypothetical protein